MTKLSLYVITYNEEDRLARTLSAAKGLADEIVIVDSGSTDRTEEIAREFGAVFIYHDWESFAAQARVAEESCSNDWVLRLDADEELTPELVEEIRRVKEAPDCDGYRLRIGDVYPGIEKPIRWAKHYRLIRLYNRTKLKMMGVLDHDDVDPIVPNPRVRTLRNFISHHSFVSMSQVITKQNRATDTQIQMLIKGGKHYSRWRMIGPTTWSFLRYYIVYRHFLYGFWGFINCVNIAYFRFTKFAKFYEYDQRRRIDAEKKGLKQ